MGEYQKGSKLVPGKVVSRRVPKSGEKGRISASIEKGSEQVP